MNITTIGLDLAKNVFQVHAIAADGSVVCNRSLRRSQLLSFFERTPPCLAKSKPMMLALFMDALLIAVF